jgi:hypothetical protein
MILMLSESGRTVPADDSVHAAPVAARASES